MSVGFPRATLDDLYKVEGKAELIGGRVVEFMASGDLPTEVAQNVYVSLRLHAKSTKVGVAKADGIGFSVPELTSGRESFSPDASYHVGPRPTNAMRFIEGAPTFAVEVRSENDYGPSAEIEMAEKRADYFEAGTIVVWDVDPEAEEVRVYRAADPTQVTIFRRGETAEADPAVPGWTMLVNDIFAV